MSNPRQGFIFAGSGVNDTDNHEHQPSRRDDGPRRNHDNVDNGNGDEHEQAEPHNEEGNKQDDALIGVITRESRTRRGQQRHQKKNSHIGQHRENFVVLNIVAYPDPSPWTAPWAANLKAESAAARWPARHRRRTRRANAPEPNPSCRVSKPEHPGQARLSAKAPAMRRCRWARKLDRLERSATYRC